MRGICNIKPAQQITIMVKYHVWKCTWSDLRESKIKPFLPQQDPHSPCWPCDYTHGWGLISANTCFANPTPWQVIWMYSTAIVNNNIQTSKDRLTLTLQFRSSGIIKLTCSWGNQIIFTVYCILLQLHTQYRIDNCFPNRNMF